MFHVNSSLNRLYIAVLPQHPQYNQQSSCGPFNPLMPSHVDCLRNQEKSHAGFSPTHAAETGDYCHIFITKKMTHNYALKSYCSMLVDIFSLQRCLRVQVL